ncbi:hypothetical protein ING2D1G_0136 [Peptoniphilus sp. ING2-D1G]|nr:hypothetical protein ING2D1G_0136 [Peptoniphilus sp. ING2-D1G]
MKDNIEKIKRAEDEAKALIEKANFEHDRIIKEAKKKSEEISEKIIDDAKKKKAEILENAKKEADLKVQPIIEEAKLKSKNVLNIKDEVLKPYVDAVIERIVVDNGNS